MKLSRQIALIGFAAGLVAVSCSGPAALVDPMNAIINGSAKDENGVGVLGVLIRISNSTIIQEFKSDSLGLFILEDVTTGQYDMNIYPPANYTLAAGQPSTIKLNLVDGQVFRPAIMLKKSPGAPSGITVGLVQIINFYYSPQIIHVARGGTITWQNVEADLHTVNSEIGTELNSGTMTRFGRYSHTFNTPGNYPYKCIFHEVMTGVIIVDP